MPNPPIPKNVLAVARLFREKYPRIDLALCHDVGSGLKVMATVGCNELFEPTLGPDDDLSRWVLYVLNTDAGEDRPDRDSYWESLQAELDQTRFEDVGVLLCSPDIEYVKPN